jgi:hypothetical protein
VFAVAAAAILYGALAVSYAAAENASSRAASGAQAQTITLRGRAGITGPWRSSLSMKLRRGGIPVSFSLCALVDSKKIPPSCHAAAGVKIPNGARLRLEQRRGNKGAWKRVGVSVSPFLDARLSNDVGGNRYGPVHYRVTLRAPNGTVLRTSNLFRVNWHR